jgi:DNA-binding response OmpR family regulator
VEDDPAIRALLVKALGMTFTVYEAGDGEEACMLFGAIPPPAALVCDIMMPKLGGLGLATVLRKSPELYRMPILFLTAKDAPRDVVAGINVGARHYVTKPFKIADILTRVKGMVQLK